MLHVNKRREDIRWSQLPSLSGSYDPQFEKKKKKILSLSFFFLGWNMLQSYIDISYTPNPKSRRPKAKNKEQRSNKDI